MTWQERMIEGLLLCRQGGQKDFSIAWKAAKRRATAMGDRRPKDYVQSGPADDPEWLPLSSFFRRAAEREWYGLAHADYQGLRELVAEDDVPMPRQARAGMRMIA